MAINTLKFWQTIEALTPQESVRVNANDMSKSTAGTRNFLSNSSHTSSEAIAARALQLLDGLPLQCDGLKRWRPSSTGS